MADLLCCCLETIGCYYVIGMCCNRAQGRPTTEGLCGCNNQQQQNNTGVYSNAPPRSTMYAQPIYDAPATRRPATYQRTSNVLGGRQQSAQQQQTTQPNIQTATAKPQPYSGTTADVNHNNTATTTVPVRTTIMPSTGGYRLGGNNNTTSNTTTPKPPADDNTTNNNITPNGTNATTNGKQQQQQRSDDVSPPSYDSHAFNNNSNNTTNGINNNHDISDSNTSRTLYQQLQSMPDYSITLLKKILSNAINSNDTQKRRIKLSNDKIQSNIVNIDGAIELLTNAGFIIAELPADNNNNNTTNNNNHDDTETYLVFPHDADKQEAIRTLDYLNKFQPDNTQQKQ